MAEYILLRKVQTQTQSQTRNGVSASQVSISGTAIAIPTLDPTPPPVVEGTWSEVQLGVGSLNGARRVLTPSEGMYPNATGVSFYKDGVFNRTDATGPNEGSVYHFYPVIDLVGGEVLRAEWTDVNGVQRDSIYTVPVVDPPPTPAPTASGVIQVSGTALGPYTAGSMPSMEEIIAGAGLSNAGILTPSGSVRSSANGQIIENLDVSGTIIIDHDDVTIRNCRVTGSSSTAVIKPSRDVRRTIVEHCEVNVGQANGAIGYLGYDTVVRYCKTTGFADGIKVETGGWYERNYCSMTEPPGEDKHLDALQASADRNYTVIHNVLDAWSDPAHNSSMMIQAWNGSQNITIYGVRIIENYVGGGNFTVQLKGGKEIGDGINPATYLTDVQFIGNVFRNDLGSPARYGTMSVDNCPEITAYGNVDHLGNVVNPCGGGV